MMTIHRTAEGERLCDIARLYGTSEEIIRMNNGFEISEEPAPGEEILIILPTRTYTVKRGDSLERLALRFGVLRRELLANNPIIEKEGLLPGRTLALKYGERKFGQAAANGYFFGGDTSSLRERLPYFTYVTVGAASLNGTEIKKLFEGREACGLVRMADKIPLLRIFGRGYSELSEKEGDELASELLRAAANGGYKGLVLGGEPVPSELLLKLRRLSLGCDLILLCEVEPSSPEHLCDGADGTIFSGNSPISCAQNYVSELLNFAAERESNRCMPEICAFAENDGKYLPICDALRVARRGSCKIEFDEMAGVCKFTHKRSGNYVFPSLENVKAILEAIHEYGYMGASFDVARTPRAHLMMYCALFGKR